jgi:ribosomal protein L32E
LKSKQDFERHHRNNQKVRQPFTACLGSHFKKIHDQWKKDKGISDEEVNKLVNSKVDGGHPPQRQSSLDGFFGGK